MNQHTSKATNHFSRLLLVSSISIASLSLVACGSDDKKKPAPVQPTPAQPAPEQPAPAPEQPEVETTAYYLAKFDAEVTPISALTWVEEDHDESVRGMTVENGKLMVMKRWYNGITRMDVDAPTQTANFVGFSKLGTAGHHIESTDEDYVSGASEHRILDTWYTGEAGDESMYTLVKKPSSTVAEDDTFGLFKVELNADGSVPQSTVKGKKVYHRGDNVTRVGGDMGDGTAELTTAIQLTDGTVLAFDNANDGVLAYSADLVLDQGRSFAVEGFAIKDWVANQNGLYMLIEKDGKLMLEMRANNNLSVAATTVEVAGASYLATNEMTDKVIVAGGKDVKVFAKDLASQTDFALANKAEGISVSTDGKRLGVKTEKIGEMVFIDFADESVAMTTLNLGEEVRHFTLADKNTMFYNSKSSEEVKKATLPDQAVALTAAELVAVALDNITEAAVNHGYHATAVRYDLELPTNDKGGLPGVEYQWSSDSAAIDTTGKITQPMAGQLSTPVKMTLTATATVGEETATATKDLALEVLAAPATANYTREIAIADAGKKDQYRVMAVNENESKLAAFKRRGGEILLIDNNDESTQERVALPAEYAKADSPFMVWKDDTHLSVFVLKNDNGVRVGGLLTLNTADNSWETTKVFAEEIYTASMDAFKQNVSIEFYNGDKENKQYVIKTYDLATMTEMGEEESLGGERTRRFAMGPDGDIRYYGVSTRNEADERVRSIHRYNKLLGGTDLVIPDTNYVMSIDQDSNKVVTGGLNGNFSVIHNAFNKTAISVDDIISVYTARNDWNGVTYSDDHHKGRTYSIGAVGDKVVTMYRDIGLSIYKRVGNKYVEEKFIADDGIERFTMSYDKSKVYTYNRADQMIKVLEVN